ncbi:MAG: glycosyltransferase family 4 protein [Bacteroidales bacterium]|nr:glycosyltransferase family 4 protein [Bacteroidales bacterium]
MKRVLFIVAHRPNRSPGQRFRFEQYLGYLSQKGFTCEISFLLSEKDDKFFYRNGNYLRKFFILIKSILIRFKDLRRIKDFDIVFIYREAVMYGSTFFERQFKRKGAQIILDFDDSIWLMDVSEANKDLKWLKRPSKTSELIQISNMVFVGNNYLADYTRQFNHNVRIIPTTLDTNNIPLKEYIPSEKICIGWTGSRTTIKHFELAVPILKKIKEKYNNKIKFKLISDAPGNIDNLLLEFCKWNKDTEIGDLQEFDIGIMPLPDDEWSRGKCGFKGLQYMALGIPAVLSPVGVNTEIVQDGVNGFLAANDEEWIEKLSLLIESPDLRKKIGLNGRKTIVEKYSFNAWKEKYISYFEELVN